MADDWRPSERVLNIPASAIHEMSRLSRQLDGVISLSWAKPTADTPEHIRRAAMQAIDDGLTGGYSQDVGLPALREAIAAKLKEHNGIEADSSEIIVTVGAIEGLAAAIMAVVDPGDEVILPSPNYSTHLRQVLVASGKPVFVPTLEEEGFAWDIDAMTKAITPKTKAILYSSPCNPTGGVYAEDQLRQLAQIAVENDLMVITDEAYEYFVYDEHKHFSVGSIPEARRNVISCFTFTKTYAMTGWRIGYMHADEALIPEIKKAHIPFAICAPVVSQYAALAALRGPQDCVAEFHRHYLSARNLMCERLDGLGSVFEYRKPHGSYLMFPRILIDEGRDSTSFCKKLLRETKVSTTPGVAFGPEGESHARLSFCVAEDDINRAFDRLESYFKQTAAR